MRCLLRASTKVSSVSRFCQRQTAGGPATHAVDTPRAGTRVATSLGMGSELVVYIVGTVAIGAFVLKQAAKSMGNRELPPVSHQWLLEQRVRDE
jgi:hypothetical protein